MPTSSLSPIVSSPDRLSLCAAAARLRVVRQTVFRWLTKGIVLPDGRRVKLAGVRLGTRYFTDEAAIAEFVAATSATPDTNSFTPPPATPAERRRTAAADSAELDRRMGVKPTR